MHQAKKRVIVTTEVEDFCSEEVNEVTRGTTQAHKHMRNQHVGGQMNQTYGSQGYHRIKGNIIENRYNSNAEDHTMILGKTPTVTIENKEDYKIETRHILTQYKRWNASSMQSYNN
eukprot:12264549-Ditylum_brightwellii.AAC.1